MGSQMIPAYLFHSHCHSRTAARELTAAHRRAHQSTGSWSTGTVDSFTGGSLSSGTVASLSLSVLDSVSAGTVGFTPHEKGMHHWTPRQ